MISMKNTYRYEVKSGSKTVYVGVTTDFDRRAAEHRRRWPDATIVKIGPVTTRADALTWEAKRIKALGSSTGTSIKNVIGRDG